MSSSIRVGLVFGPFIPVYGLGAVAITLLLWRMYNQKDIMIFLASMYYRRRGLNTCAALCKEAPCPGQVSWEYSDSPLNIGWPHQLDAPLFGASWAWCGVRTCIPAPSRRI